MVINRELDDRLEREAAARGVSKSALVREALERELHVEPFDNGLWTLGLELAPLFADVEPVDIDTELYGPLEADS